MDPETNGQPAEEKRSGQFEETGEVETSSESTDSLAGRIVGAGTGRARRMVGATGIDQALETAVEDAIVRAIESEAVERSMTRILNGPLIENAVRDAMTSQAFEDALLEIGESDLIDRIWARILDSDETQRLIERIAEAPEVRAAIASQGLGLVDDLGRGVARVTRILDFMVERVARRVLFRKERTTATDHVGVVTRLLALALDAVIMNVVMITSTALLGLIASAIGVDLGNMSGAAFAIGGIIWLALGSLYLFVFWTISGQTPGMRFLDIRVEYEGRRAIGPRRAFKRLVGFWLAAIPFCLGFIGVATRLDRRGFHDHLGGTMVYYFDPAGPNQPRLEAVIDPKEEAESDSPPIE